MTLKGAAVLAFIGTLLVAALLVWDFVFTVLNVIRGLIPAVTVFSSLIYAFGALSVTVFFYIFQKQRS
jgi:multidrug efflux pump subunit AcrB